MAADYFFSVLRWLLDVYSYDLDYPQFIDFFELFGELFTKYFSSWTEGQWFWDLGPDAANTYAEA